MSDLVKQMRATLSMGVISKGSEPFEYAIAEQQFKKAADEIERLREVANHLKNGLLEIATVLEKNGNGAFAETITEIHLHISEAESLKQGEGNE